MKLKNQSEVNRITISAMLLALAWILPLLTGQIPEIGNMFLPMHIPVFLAGLMLGPKYGLMLGFIMPLSRSLIFTSPPFYPNAISMAFELATYGLIAGVLFHKLNQIQMRFYINLYTSLIVAMISGRLIWGLVQSFIGLFGNLLTLEMFLRASLYLAWPGLIVQLILIPLILIALIKSGLLSTETGTL